MATAADYWYVRLPDGRTLRARNADVVRSYLRAGRLPLDSLARRSGEDEWLPLDHIAEFVDAVPGETARGTDGRGPSRATPGELRAVGVRGLIDELFNAFDSCLNRAKLTIAALTGVAIAVGMIALDLLASFPAGMGALMGYFAAGLFLLIAVSVATVLLTQITVVELDRHRTARAAEVRAGLAARVFRVLFGYGLIAGLLVGLVLFFHAAVPRLAAADLGDLNAAREILVDVAAVLRLLLDVLCWPVLGIAVLLLGPLLVIEEYSILRSLREWLGMLRRHVGRVYLYEALAFTLATVLALPMLVVVGLAANSVAGTMTSVERITLWVLGGLALTPFIAYLTVANVFIYLNLRYEFFYSARDR
jgi:hypothetical protein